METASKVDFFTLAVIPSAEVIFTVLITVAKPYFVATAATFCSRMLQNYRVGVDSRTVEAETRKCGLQQPQTTTGLCFLGRFKGEGLLS